MTARRVTATVTDGIGRLRLARPDKRNAIDHAMADEAIAAMDAFVRADAPVAVLQAEPPVFCSGNDLTDKDTLNDPSNAASIRLTAALLTTPLFWIAEVSAPALGGGLALISACPVALASNQAWFSLPEQSLGLFPSGVLPYLEAVIGPRPAFDIALSGRRVNAEEAARLGLVTETPHEELTTRAQAQAARLQALPSLADDARKAWQSRFSMTGFCERRDQLGQILRETTAIGVI